MAAITIINFIFGAFQLLLLARVIFSWIRVNPYDPIWGPIHRFVHEATEPFIAPVRRMMPPTGMFDFSIIIVWFIAALLQRLLVSFLI
jgi:YggT family protein